MRPFESRQAAGRALAQAVARQLTPLPDLVLGLPRGGVPVAAEVARHLGVPLDVMIVRKVGMPGQEEYALGAVASAGIVVREPHAVAARLVDDSTFGRLAAEQNRIVETRARLFRGDRPPLQLNGRSVLLVDDGIATGSSLRAAILAARQAGAQRVQVAVPIAPRDAMAALASQADAVVVLETPEDFHAVGQGYVDFAQVDDEEVVRLLAAPGNRSPCGASAHWEHFRHDADIGVRGFGATREDAMANAALAVTAAVTDPKLVHAAQRVDFKIPGSDADMLLYDWLNAVIYEMATRKMLFRDFRLRRTELGLDACAWGEPIDIGRHQPAAEPKGATFTELAIAPAAHDRWMAQCVVDL